ncbi:MAG: NAD(P)-dependent oxidoreductase [Bdellovibrio sp.]
MKVFLTGSTGGIGGWVYKELQQHGIEVAALIRPSSSGSLNLSGPVIHGDLTDLAAIESEFARFQPDVVIHLAWLGVDQKEKSNPGQIHNLQALAELLRLSQKYKVRSFIGMGSESEYGVHNKKIDENTPTLPRSHYALCKLAAGLLAQKMCQDAQIHFTWLRLFSSYGPNDRPGSLMSLLIKTLLAGKPMNLSGCEQVWDYIYVQDIARLIAEIAVTPREPGFYNLGGGQATVLKNIVLKIAALINPQAELHFGAIPYSPGQLMHLEADISKLLRVYSWRPQVRLEDGLKEAIRFHQR